MKIYKYVKTWIGDDGKRKVVRSDEEEVVWMKYLKERYGFGDDLETKTNMTVSEWVEVAVPRYKKNVAKITYQDYNATIRKWVLPVIGEKDLADVSHADCQKVLNQLKGYSQRTISGMDQILNFIFKSAIWNNKIDKNPAAYLYQPKCTERKHRRNLTSEEREALLKLFSGPLGFKFRMFEIMYYCGLRPSECWRLTTDDLLIKKGKPILHIKEGKSKAANRYVPFPEHLMKYFLNLNHGDHLCQTEKGTVYNKTSYRRTVSRLYRELDILMGAKLYRNKIIKSKLRDDFVPYNLRHDYCSRLKNSGVDLRYAQYLMGHSNISVTSDIYTHTSLSDIVRISDKILEGVTGCYLQTKIDEMS